MSFREEYVPGQRVLLALIVLTGMRLVFASEIAFLEDEAYYRLWGLYPNYAYFDHAPMVGWWIAIGQSIFGDTHLGLRFLSPIAGFLGSLFLWRTAYLIIDRAGADCATLTFNAMFLVGIGSVIMTPDIPSVFFWTLSLWAVVEWHRSGARYWWLIFGFVAGLGLLSKYTHVFFGAGLILWLVASGKWRDAIRTPQFWFAGAIVCIIFSPVLYWNWAHDWASFAKQIGRLSNSTFTLRYLGEWIAGQIFMISPVLMIFVVSGYYKSLMQTRSGPHSISLIVMTAAPMLLYFLYNSFTSRINANWTAPILVNFALLASAELFKFRDSVNRHKQVLAKLALPSGYGIYLFVLIAAMITFLPPDKRNPISNIRGYGELADAIDEQRIAQNAKFIVTSRYSLTGLLSYELRDRAQVYQFTDRIRFEHMPKPDRQIETSRLIYVTDDRNKNDFIVDAKSCFKTIEPLSYIVRSDRGVPLLTYHLWLIEGVDQGLLNTGEFKQCGHAPK